MCVHIFSLEIWYLLQKRDDAKVLGWQQERKKENDTMFYKDFFIFNFPVSLWLGSSTIYISPCYILHCQSCQKNKEYISIYDTLNLTQQQQSEFNCTRNNL